VLGKETRMSEIRSYKDLLVWQRAMELVVMCYRLTDRFPIAERYGLTSEVRRSAVSIPSNIAEGYQRRSTGAYLHHLSISLGSQGELETQLEISRRLGLRSDSDVRAVITETEEVGRMLYALVESVRRSPRGGARSFSYRAPSA
jgi:four helix bundle protein